MRQIELGLAVVGGFTVLVALFLACAMLNNRLKAHVHFTKRYGGWPAQLDVFRLRVMMLGARGSNGVLWREADVEPRVYRTLAGFYR